MLARPNRPGRQSLDLEWGRKQNVWFSELTAESGPSHYCRGKVGSVGYEGFAGLNKALAHLERFWVD